MLVAECLQGALGPGVQNPVLGVRPGLLSLVSGLIPRVLDLGDQSILAGVGVGLRLDALGFEICTELLGVPGLIGCDDVVVPVLLDQVVELLSVSGGGVWDVIVGEPALELCFVPLVVCWK